MAVDSAISSIANSSSSYSATSKGKTSGSDLDKEAFLNLLVTQMQYQDPLNPSDNTEYTITSFVLIMYCRVFLPVSMQGTSPLFSKYRAVFLLIWQMTRICSSPIFSG